MWKWYEKNFDKIMLFACLWLAITVIVGMSMAMYNLQAYYGKENICREGSW